MFSINFPSIFKFYSQDFAIIGKQGSPENVGMTKKRPLNFLMNVWLFGVLAVSTRPVGIAKSFEKAKVPLKSTKPTSKA